jgi:hypothetical protein
LPKKGKIQNLVTLEMDHRKFDRNGNIFIDETISTLLEYTKKLNQFADLVKSFVIVP